MNIMKIMLSCLSPKQNKVPKVCCVARQSEAWSHLFVIILSSSSTFMIYHSHHPPSSKSSYSDHHSHHIHDISLVTLRDTWTLNTPGALRISGMILPPSEIYLIRKTFPWSHFEIILQRFGSSVFIFGSRVIDQLYKPWKVLRKCSQDFNLERRHLMILLQKWVPNLYQSHHLRYLRVHDHHPHEFYHHILSCWSPWSALECQQDGSISQRLTSHIVGMTTTMMMISTMRMTSWCYKLVWW